MPPTDELAKAQKAALEREKAGYELRLKTAEGDEAENLKARVKAVDAAIDVLSPKKTSTKKKESKSD